MRVLLDTNIIMDALQERSPFDTYAKEILMHAEDSSQLSCLFTANAATDIFYLYAKSRNLVSAKVALRFLLATFSVIAVTHEDCIEAVSHHIDDFEDALLVVCARKSGIDYIVSRDDKLLQSKTEVKIISPKELLGILGEKRISE